VKAATYEDAASKLPVLGALALFLSTIEYMMPKPLPFIRLGLANTPLLIALRFPPSLFFSLAAVKILGQALVSGTLFSYIFLLSLSGTLVSASLMYVLRRAVPEKYMSLAGISAAGALFSNAVQITLARFFFLGSGAVYIAPPFLAVGLVSGTALGLFCERFTAQSLWFRNCPAESAVRVLPSAPYKAVPAKKTLLNTAAFPPAALFGAGLLMSLCIFFSNTAQLRLILFFVSVAAALASGKAGNLLFTILFFAAIVFFNVLVPYGRVICVIGVFPLTEGALLEGIKKAAALESLVMVSRVTISPRLRLPGRAGELLSEALRLFPRFMEKKKEVHAKTLVKDIDRILLELTRQR
jgi:heptaprenyl diphosphate synthase